MATSIIKQTMNESDSDYCKMPDGTLIQWGEEANASSANRPITFPIPFVSNKYAVNGSNASGTQASFMVSNSSAAAFTVYAGGNVRLLWIAIGRWK